MQQLQRLIEQGTAERAALSETRQVSEAGLRDALQVRLSVCLSV